LKRSIHTWITSITFSHMEATIGPDSWARSTINNIKLAQTVVQRSDKFNDLGRQLDPLPSLRDKCIQQSNAQIHSYVREARYVVIKLRDCLLNTEEEIKSLLRGKEKLEKVLEHIRKDLLLNEESQSGRKSKPLREKETDGADDLLAAEKRQLLRIKRALEAQLRSVQKQLQVLDNARKRLKSVLSERARVLDLVCHTSESSRAQTCEYGMRKDRPKTPEVNPVGPFTPEANQSINIATEAIEKSQTLLKEVADFIEHTTRLQKDIHKSVNDGITKKASESVSMKQHLQLTAGENRMAIHRGNRWHYTTELSRGYTLGPVSSMDLTTRERLDRPHVRTYQRHPGTQLPEAQKIIDGNYGLVRSLEAINRNVGMLKITEDRLKDDIRGKHIGAEVDASIVRNRRRKANHRWVIGGLKC